MDARSLLRRYVLGLAVAAVVAATLTTLLNGWIRGLIDRDSGRRTAVARTVMLAELVGAEAIEGEATRGVVDAFVRSHPEVEQIRVVVFPRSLVASTSPDDRGERAAPRNLDRDEKPLFDLGKSLEQAVANNREGTGPRKDELAVEKTSRRGTRVVAPIEVNGEVEGLLETVSAPGARSSRFPFHPALLLLLLPTVVVAMIGRWLGGWLRLAVVATVLFVAAFVWGGSAVWGRVVGDWQATQERFRDAMVGEQGFAREHAGQLVDTTFDPASWDVDRFRQPLDLLGSESTGGTDRLALVTDRIARLFNRTQVLVALVALILLHGIGLGTVARLRQIVVRYRAAYGYVTPAMLGMLVLVFFPFLYGIAISFSNQNVYNVEESIVAVSNLYDLDRPLLDMWVGLGNYSDIVADLHVFERTDDGIVFRYQNFYWTLAFTIVWTVVNVSIGVSVGLLLALILNTKGLYLRPVYRVLLILPWAVPNYITALIWRGMFHQQFGVINQVVQIFGGAPVAWFEKPLTSFCAVVATNGWLSFPFMMVICLGALQSIPADLYEAARVDGATRWQQFTTITLPSLKPALVPAVILSVVWTFNMFNIIYLVSAGEPAGATEILITDAYKIAFEQYRYGYAAAYSTVIFGVLLLYGVWQNRVTRATEGI
jgi:arabinogalactan oligomer/maltooligosaccharide transport system permease protein